MVWSFLVIGYLLSVLVETPILAVGLASRHGMARRLAAGFWLTACTYPLVVLVLPYCFASRGPYLFAAETFAPIAECALFLGAFGLMSNSWKGAARDCAVIGLANLASFAFGEWLWANGWLT